MLEWIRKRGRRFLRTDDIINALVELLKVKTIITLAIIGVMSYLAVTGDIATDTFMAVAGSVVTYYFTRGEK